MRAVRYGVATCVMTAGFALAATVVVEIRPDPVLVLGCAVLLIGLGFWEVLLGTP